MDSLFQKPRWIYRFDNFKRAFLLLREGLETKQSRPLTSLEMEGLIQRFEYTWELAWKVLKDYLECQGVVLDTITPIAIIKAAFIAQVIDEADVWMRALDARNKMAHTYNFKTFEATVAAIETDFLRILENLYLYLLEISIEDTEK